MDADRTLERHLREREEIHLRYDLRSRQQSMAELLADDFVEFGSSGRIVDRTSAIQAASAQAPFHFRIDTFSAKRLCEQVVLTTYRLSVWSGSDNDARITLRSSIWIYREDLWRMVFHQGTLTMAGVA